MANYCPSRDINLQLAEIFEFFKCSIGYRRNLVMSQEPIVSKKVRRKTLEPTNTKWQKKCIIQQFCLSYETVCCAIPQGKSEIKISNE